MARKKARSAAEPADSPINTEQGNTSMQTAETPENQADTGIEETGATGTTEVGDAGTTSTEETAVTGETGPETGTIDTDGTADVKDGAANGDAETPDESDIDTVVETNVTAEPVKVLSKDDRLLNTIRDRLAAYAHAMHPKQRQTAQTLTNNQRDLKIQLEAVFNHLSPERFEEGLDLFYQLFAESITNKQSAFVERNLHRGLTNIKDGVNIGGKFARMLSALHSLADPKSRKLVAKQLGMDTLAKDVAQYANGEQFIVRLAALRNGQ